MKHSFRILPEHKLIIECCGTSFGLDDYTEFKKRELSHPLFNPGYNVLTDLRWSKFAVPATDVHKMVAFFKENVPVGVSRKGCLLTLQPLQTAYSMLFEKHMVNSSVTWKVCTTVTECISYLNYPLAIDEIEVFLAELKEQREG